MLSDHKISIFISVCGKMMVCCYFTLLHLWCSSSPHPMLSTVSVHLWMLSLVTPAVHANRYIVPFVGVIEAPGSVFLSQLKSDLWLWLVAILGWHFVDEAPSRRKRPVAAGHPVCPKHKSSSAELTRLLPSPTVTTQTVWLFRCQFILFVKADVVTDSSTKFALTCYVNLGLSLPSSILSACRVSVWHTEACLTPNWNILLNLTF